MLLYRVIPDAFVKQYLGTFHPDCITTEDIFYKMGYLNVSKHSPYFTIKTDSLELAEPLCKVVVNKAYSFLNPQWTASEHLDILIIEITQIC